MADNPALQSLLRVAAAVAVAMAACVALAEHLLVAPAIVLGAPFVIMGTLMTGSANHSRSGPVVAWVGLLVVVVVLVSYNWLIPTSFDAATGRVLVG